MVMFRVDLIGNLIPFMIRIMKDLGLWTYDMPLFLTVRLGEIKAHCPQHKTLAKMCSYRNSPLLEGLLDSSHVRVSYKSKHILTTQSGDHSLGHLLKKVAHSCSHKNWQMNTYDSFSYHAMNLETTYMSCRRWIDISAMQNYPTQTINKPPTPKMHGENVKRPRGSISVTCWERPN